MSEAAAFTQEDLNQEPYVYASAINFFDILSIVALIYITFRILRWIINSVSSPLHKKYCHDNTIEKRMMREHAKGVLPILPRFEFIKSTNNESIMKKHLKKIFINNNDPNAQEEWQEGIEVEYICKIAGKHHGERVTFENNLHSYESNSPLFSDEQLTHDTSSTTNLLEHIHDIYYVIPGNPGNCLIYHNFMEEICKKLENRNSNSLHLVVAVSLRGHSYYYPSRWWKNEKISHTSHSTTSRSLYDQLEVYNLEDQIDYHLTVIQQLHKQMLKKLSKNRSQPTLKIHLLGHSVGCYIISRVLERMHLLNLSEFYSKCIGNIFFYYPTLQNMHKETPNGQSMLQYFIQPHIRKHLCNLLHNIASPLLPSFIIRLLRSSQPILVPFAPYYFDSMRIIKNVTTLACHEFNEILHSFGVLSNKENEMNTFKQVLRDKKHNIYAIFSTSDLWVPRKHLLSFLEHVFDICFEKTHDMLLNPSIMNDQDFCKHVNEYMIQSKNVNQGQLNINTTTKHAYVIHHEDLHETSELILKASTLFAQPQERNI
ncbi:hypothetical protein C9374_005445 [Naegleria lovaniensis]|uniref:Lipid droplet-associated serine hydrolase n=1 Tax=Naegleria lovaniensis TaxID=51637 RepID=A0AA88GQD0_NAELO|nr:uncharacterized protein C9374_005445 [Naegleria lovaniensis]KAG2382243.1 hypothetical protein C9374_005445 [Naegleria lovaniensis]